MTDLTSGIINQESVNQYLECLEMADGNINEALQNAYDKYNLNTGARTEDNDSWYEALARFNS